MRQDACPYPPQRASEKGLPAQLPAVDLPLQDHRGAGGRVAELHVEVRPGQVLPLLRSLGLEERPGEAEPERGRVGEVEVLDEPSDPGELLNGAQAGSRGLVGEVQLGEPGQRREPGDVAAESGEPFEPDEPLHGEGLVDEGPLVAVQLAGPPEGRVDLAGLDPESPGERERGEVGLLDRDPLRGEGEEDVAADVGVDGGLEGQLHLLEERPDLVLRQDQRGRRLLILGEGRVPERAVDHDGDLRHEHELSEGDPGRGSHVDATGREGLRLRPQVRRRRLCGEQRQQHDIHHT